MILFFPLRHASEPICETEMPREYRVYLLALWLTTLLVTRAANLDPGARYLQRRFPDGTGIPEGGDGARPDSPSFAMGGGGGVTGVGVRGCGGGLEWPGGVVPYVIVTESAPEGPERSRFEREVVAALRHFAGYPDLADTIAWRPRDPDDPAHIAFRYTRSGASSSHVGWTGRPGAQDIYVSRWARRGTILHEMCHALGLAHEHQRRDRDRHVIVGPDAGDDVNYAVEGVPHGPYDPRSIMHYEALLRHRPAVLQNVRSDGSGCYWCGS